MVNMLIENLRDRIAVLELVEERYKELKEKHDNLNEEYKKLMRAYNDLRVMYFQEYHENQRSQS